MAAHPPAADLVPLPATGRRFTGRSTVRLGDVDPRGLLRLDAIARHLQDVANDDAAASGLANSFGWVVRRTLVSIERAGVLGEHLQLTTFCSGTGRSWAERRTSATGDRGAAFEAVSLWVQVDPVSGRPTALGDDFHAIYDAAAGERRVSSRLSLGDPPDGAASRPWEIRAVDLDVFDHVNNAVQWALLEEELIAAGSDRAGVAEIEYLAPVDARDVPATVLTAGGASGNGDAAIGVWLVSDGAVRAALRWTPATGDR